MSSIGAPGKTEVGRRHIHSCFLWRELQDATTTFAETESRTSQVQQVKVVSRSSKDVTGQQNTQVRLTEPVGMAAYLQKTPPLPV